MGDREISGEKPPAELYLPATLLAETFRKYARAIAEMERVASSIIGSPVEFCDYGPDGWAIRYQGKTYMDTQFGESGG